MIRACLLPLKHVWTLLSGRTPTLTLLSPPMKRFVPLVLLVALGLAGCDSVDSDVASANAEPIGAGTCARISVLNYSPNAPVSIRIDKSGDRDEQQGRLEYLVQGSYWRDSRYQVEITQGTIIAFPFNIQPAGVPGFRVDYRYTLDYPCENGRAGVATTSSYPVRNQGRSQVGY